MSSALGHIRLGDATYQVGTERIVTASGDEVLLRSQSALVLRHLVDHLGQLTPRDDLIAEVWPDVAVTDDSLTQCISDIRRAIGDTKREILKTVPKRGYMLHGEAVAPVSPAPTAGPLQALPGDAPASARRVSDWQDPATQATGPSIMPQLDPRDVLPTLAVLPFRAQPGSSNGSMMSMFLGDEIARAISRSEDMNVISRLSTLDLSNHGGARDAGRLLNADFILSGSVLEMGETIILMLEFAEADSQLVLWSDRVALRAEAWLSEAENIDEIVIHVRRAIMINEVRRARSAPLSDLKLFSVLHGAVGLMHRFDLTDFDRAQNYLDYVISNAPNHPTPLAWLARWHVLRTVQGWADDPQQEAQTALDFTARALDIDPNHTLALVCEGQVLAHLKHRLDEARSRYDAALALNPNDARGLGLRGMFLAIQDHGEEGKRDTERALHLSPLHPHRFFFLAQASAANIAAKDYSRAVTLAKESLRLNRTHVSTLRTLVIAQVGAGQIEDAQKTATELLRLHPSMRVSNWLRNSPSSGYELGQSAAEKLRSVGIPD
ncbi:winged helix-turn-helix domain-containing tetratricopeptide repeat protein [Tateyamaria sp. 1078]